MKPRDIATIRVQNHPLLKQIEALRCRAASNFDAEFSGLRGSDYDRGLLDTYHVVKQHLVEQELEQMVIEALQK